MTANLLAPGLLYRGLVRFALRDGSGNPMLTPAVTVLNLDTTQATPYAGRTGSTTVSNPLPTGVTPAQSDIPTAGIDTLGNLAIYLEPGFYVLKIVNAGATTYEGVDCKADPLDLAAHIADTTLHGANTELAYIDNVPQSGITALVTVAPGQTQPVPGLQITIPASARPVWVEWCATLEIDDPGNGDLQLAEVGGQGLLVGIGDVSYNNSDYIANLRKKRLGPTTTSRTFRVQVQNNSSAGNVIVYAGLNHGITVDCFLTAYTR